MADDVIAGDVDLAVDGDGRWDIEIRGVQCPVGNTAIQYWFQGSNEWYLKLQIRNARWGNAGCYFSILLQRLWEALYLMGTRELTQTTDRRHCR